MKRIIALAFAAVSLTACNDDAETDTTTVDTDTTTTTTTTTSTNTAYVPGEGDVTYREKKVMVYRNGDWVEADNDVTLDDGVVVRRSGRVERDGKG
jgi:outer membrane biogenesis lipoprotein LolB